MDNETGDVISIFTLAHKALDISKDALSKLSTTSKNKLKRYANLDESNDSYSLSAFLIAQFGKNYSIQSPTDWNGNRIMEKTFEILGTVQKSIGDGVVYLECEDKSSLLNFYQNEQNRFHSFDKRYS